MKLTISEAENILRRVFAAEIQGSTLTIEDEVNVDPANIRPSGTTMAIQASTFDRIMRLMSKEPKFKIDAIKLYREMVPGTGLAEAKAYVERIAQNP